MIARDGVERLGTCAAEGCDQVFVDVSRNRSKRFCDTACAARTKQAAYRARQREAG
jgi:predicted RNA-binding Zn ribbon-like protein